MVSEPQPSVTNPDALGDYGRVLIGEHDGCNYLAAKVVGDYGPAWFCTKCGWGERIQDGAALISVERQRQVAAEGWTPEHDDEHNQGEMVDAAVCYALHAAFGPPRDDMPPPDWPWADAWWKPSEDPVRDLVRAGALIAAEIDRLQRLIHNGGSDG